MKFDLNTAILAVLLFVSANVYAEVEVSTNGGLKISSGDFQVQIGGRLQYDYNRSELNGVVDEDDFDARRARLFVSGNVGDDWAYKVNWNVDGDGFEDLYLRYNGFGSSAVITLGNQHQAFTLSQLISSRAVSISERPGIVERYLIGRRESVQLHGNLDKLHYAVGFFKEDGTNEDNGFAGRVTYAPIHNDKSLFHLGASIKQTEEQDAIGIELAGFNGPIHFQAEYFDADEVVAIEDDNGDVIGEFDDSINGFYVQAGYVFTGETRPYKNGTFSRIKPKGDGGAWELVARYENGDGGFGDIELGNSDATAYAVGLNYYHNDYVRINGSYQWGESNLTNDDGNEIRIRFQVVF